MIGGLFMTQILVIEDEIHIQRLIKLILEKQGLEVVTAQTGELGLKHLKDQQKPQLIILDIMMPGIGGLAVLKSIRENSQVKHIPVILLTALAQENIVIQGIKLGAKDYIRKPFHPRDFVKRLQKHIAQAA